MVSKKTCRFLLEAGFGCDILFFNIIRETINYNKESYEKQYCNLNKMGKIRIEI
jgi:hypothetical protein